MAVIHMYVYVYVYIRIYVYMYMCIYVTSHCKKKTEAFLFFLKLSSEIFLGSLRFRNFYIFFHHSPRNPKGVLRSPGWETPVSADMCTGHRKDLSNTSFHRQ
jgi:hypothetical protein